MTRIFHLHPTNTTLVDAEMRCAMHEFDAHSSAMNILQLSLLVVNLSFRSAGRFDEILYRRILDSTRHDAVLLRSHDLVRPFKPRHGNVLSKP